uniref:Uncharacterized protein n=1 Tax=Nelumbo nucifera TaxID=4432 RepID=A0A822XJ19_NELNU|nr:TPA_asm: hypothetical protein HUJ06_022977 [Nelumbo nucifera]
MPSIEVDGDTFLLRMDCLFLVAPSIIPDLPKTINMLRPQAWINYTSSTRNLSVFTTYSYNLKI